jgi:hypothetical protein
LVDTLDLKSSEQQCSCGFKSRLEYFETCNFIVAGFFVYIYGLNFICFENSF